MRIVHFSDLHIGQDIANYVSPRIDGFAAAEYESLRQLTIAGNRRAVSSRATVPLAGTPVCVVSGDLSARGDPQELTNAFTFLMSELVGAFGAEPVGLHYKDRSLNLILGNHDIWGGQSSLLAWFRSDAKKQKAAALFNNHDGMFPWKIHAKRPQDYFDVGTLRIRGYMLDSTLPGLGNVFARGRVSQSNLDRLRECVLKDEVVDKDASNIEQCLRILVMHHPVETAKRYWINMILENASAVKRTLLELKFGLVLTGHIHERDIREISPGLFQCTSGSSSQTERERRSELSFFGYEVTAGGSMGSNYCTVTVTPFVRAGFQGVPFMPQVAKTLNVSVVAV